MDPLNYFLSASVSVPLIHPHNLLFKLSFYSAIPESPRADCPLVNFPVCFKQELLCLANLPPSTRDKWPFESAAIPFLAWWEWFLIRGKCILCFIEQCKFRHGIAGHTDEKSLGVGICCHGNSKTRDTKVAWSGLLCFEHRLCQIFVSSSKFKVHFSALMSMKITNY